MAHYVQRKGYWSLEESYRDPITGKPKKRYLRYIGKKASDPQARMEQMLATAERKAQEIEEYQRATFGETYAEKRERLENEAKFSQQKFLEESVVESRDTPSAELDQSQADSNKQGEGDESKSGGDGDAAIGEGHD